MGGLLVFRLQKGSRRRLSSTAHYDVLNLSSNTSGRRTVRLMFDELLSSAMTPAASAGQQPLFSVKRKRMPNARRYTITVAVKMSYFSIRPTEKQEGPQTVRLGETNAFDC